MEYRIRIGTLQCYLEYPTGVYWFGPVTYERDKPVYKDWMKEKAESVVNALNAGEIDLEQAKVLLNKINYF